MELAKYISGTEAIPKIKASDAKNTFGQILDSIDRTGLIEITKHNREKAYVVSIEVFEEFTKQINDLSMQLTQLQAQIPDPLEVLTSEFDDLVESMRADTAEISMDKLFDVSSLPTPD